MNKKLDPQLLQFSKTMRHTATDVEQLMWQILRAKRFMSLKFRRQHVIKPYIVDFYCHEIGLVIELDGSHAMVRKVAMRHVKASGKCVWVASKLSGGTIVILVDDQLKAKWSSSQNGRISFRRSEKVRDVVAYKLYP